MLKKIKFTDNNFELELHKIAYPQASIDTEIISVVAKILLEVASKGDEALYNFTKQFDNFEINDSNFKVVNEEIEEAYSKIDKDILSALVNSYARVKDYHERQIPLDEKYPDSLGNTLGWKWNPINAVGLYVPGGKAFYPSSVIMNAVPALVAGVRRIVITTPAINGKVNPLVLAAAKICGINEIYKIGGAQAVASLAYGTKNILPVDKIVGPGNAYVAEAKRQVFGRVGIDMIAGPSEIMVIADDTANPKFVACDLLSQAEHDEKARPVLVCQSEDFADKVNKEVEINIEKLGKREIALNSVKENGIIFITQNFLDEAVMITNYIAPEHLEIMTAKPENISKRITNAGAIFLGHYTPEAFGDYLAGPSHVLPTYGTARFSSGLGVLDFMKRTSMIKATEESLVALSGDIIRIANEEKLDAHALSVRERVKDSIYK